MNANRRTFVKSVLCASAGALASRTGAVAQTSGTLPDPASSGIDHIVVVTMENRSFDHLMGWLPGANGKQANLTYVDNSGVSYATHPLAPDYTGCPHPDPDHSYGPDRVVYDSGNMDGFLRAGNNDVYAIGYYGEADIPFYAALAQTYMACDNWFASILGPTFPNRMFLWAAQTDRLDDSVSSTGLPTIFDRLASKKVSHRYYFNNVPYLSLWGLKYMFSTSPFGNFLADASAGTLPAVSFVDPVFTVLDDGTGNDDHPHADIRNGDAFISKVFNAVSNGPKWKNTVLIITFDEWGGFFEHVAPPRVVAPNNVDPDLVNGAALLGFRVPTVIASPFTYGGGINHGVDHTVYDHTAILKLIEWRWGLTPLTKRDASLDIGNPATSFNFSSPTYILPVLPEATPHLAAPCFQGGIFSSSAVTAGTAPQRPAATTKRGFASLANSQAVRDWAARPRFASQVLFK